MSDLFTPSQATVIDSRRHPTRQRLPFNGAGELYLGDVKSAFIDALHTAKLFFEPITPGVTLLADRGHAAAESAWSEHRASRTPDPSQTIERATP